MVSYWAVVGPGYNWLLSGLIVTIGVATAFAGNAALGAVATAAALAAGLLGRRHKPAAVLFAIAAATQLVVAAAEAGLVQAVTGAVLLGAMTSEMLLGHWFLVDPRLPRWSLRRLDLATGAGLVADVAVLAALGAVTTGDGVMTAAFLALATMTGLLIAAVWFSLQEPAYSGVMAATGLSYLGVLTAFGVVVVGRLLVTGL